jgi:hypothetical protein
VRKMGNSASGSQYMCGWRPRCWGLKRVLTKLCCVENVFVEDDRAGTEGDPRAAWRLVPAAHNRAGVHIRNVYRRVERGGLRRRLERLRVDRGQDGQGGIAGCVHRGPHFLVGRHGRVWGIARD